MPRFIAHAGAHKTGSTAFQIWVRDNRALLFDHGLLTPGAGASLDGNYRAFFECWASAEKGTPQSRANLRGMIDRSISTAPSHDILISAEYMSTVDALSLVAPFAAEVAARGYERHVVIVVRDQADTFNSANAQLSKMLIRDHSFAEMVEGRMGIGGANWANFAATYAAHGFEVHVLTWDDGFRSTGSTRAILNHPLFARYDLPDPGAPQRHNESIGERGMIVSDLVAAAAKADNGVLPVVLRRRLRTMIAMRLSALGPDRPFNGLTPAIAAQIAAMYEQSNAAFASRYLDRPWREIFPAPTIPDRPSPETLDDLSPPEADRVRSVADTIIARARAANWFVRGPSAGRDHDRQAAASEISD